MSKLRRPLAALLAAALALTPTAFAPTLRAEPSAGDLETARDLFKAGKKLRDAGDLPGALDKLKAAHALAGTPITGVELGRTYLAMHRLVEARETFLEVGRIPASAKDSANAKAARAEAAQLEAATAPRIPSILVKLTGVPAGASATVTLDGVSIPSAAVGEARKVDPGDHVVAARIDDGPESTAQVTVAEQQTKVVDLAVVAPVARPVTTTTATTTGASVVPPTTTHDDARRVSPLVYVGFGTAALGAIVGSVTGAVSVSKASRVKSACAAKECPPSAQDDIDGAKATGTISTISFVVGGVGAVVGIVALVVGGGRSEPSTGSSGARVTPYVGLGTVGLTGAF